MIRVRLPEQLRTLAGVGKEVGVEVAGEITLRGVIDAIEASYPMLRGTIRDPATGRRRPFIPDLRRLLSQIWLLTSTDRGSSDCRCRH